MSGQAAFRGQPLLLLAALLLGWGALRALVWQGYEPADPVATALIAGPNAFASSARRPNDRVAPERSAIGSGQPPLPPVPDGFEWPDIASPPQAQPVAAPSAPAPTLASGSQHGSARQTIGHNLLLLACLSPGSGNPVLAAYLGNTAGPVPAALATSPAPPPETRAAPGLLAVGPVASIPSRWSADAWVLLRRDDAVPLVAAQPSYGRSQVGAVARYVLASGNAHRPQAYARLASALSGPRERELALGLSARPLAGVPLRLAVEGRAGDTATGTRLRPAAYVVTEFPPLALPMGLRAEAYAQAGYVGGRDATAFADGQARIDRAMVRRGSLEARLGAGAWGGAQRGAARLDIGPSAVATFRLGEVYGRVAADYRVRVAGAARPASGPALTVSAGF